MHRLIEYRPPRIAMGLVVLATVAHLLSPLSLHATLPAAATITGILGFSLMLRAWWLFKLANTAICPTDTATALLTHDVYSISRNPMYLGMLLMLIALGMFTGSAAFYIATIGYGLVINLVFMNYEEQKSLCEFGDDYVAYAQRVRRWL